MNDWRDMHNGDVPTPDWRKDDSVVPHTYTFGRKPSDTYVTRRRFPMEHYRVTTTDQPIAVLFTLADAIEFIKLQLAKGRTMTIVRVIEEE